MQLRPYQEILLNNTLNSYKRGKQRPCIVLPCGGGKSCILAEICRRATMKGNRILFLIHRRELLEQITNTFIEWGVNMDLCTIGMIQTISKRIDNLSPPDLIITDENHHCIANTYKKIYNAFPDVKCIGVTATPIRLNGGGLGDVCDDLIIGVSAKWLIENKYLSPYKYYSVPIANFDNVKIKAGEYDIVQLSEIMEDNVIYGDTVSNYKNISDGKKTIVYCTSVKTAYDTAQEFVSNGYKAAALSGKSSKDERHKTMTQFRNNEIDILCNCNLFSEGIDIANVECVILLRKTKSLTLYTQQAMRALRFKPDKTAIIIDHVGNIFEHNFPDADREWNLDPKKKKSAGEIKIKTCPQCYAVLLQNVLVCQYCGCDFTKEVNERLEKERIEAELVIVESENLERLKNMKYSEIRNFTTWEELVKYQRIKKYKFFWCIRQAKLLNISIPKKYDKMIWRFGI